MRPLPFFLSVVVVVRNQADDLREQLGALGAKLSGMVDSHELVVVDNASADASVAELESLTGEAGLADLQIYALNKQVERDAAAWVGVEHALGDYVAVLDLARDDVGFLGEMLQEAASGAEVVFAHNRRRERLPLAYRLAQTAFYRLYAAFNGVHLAREAPPYRLLSKRVVNFILQHPQPSLTYRHLPATGGFATTHLRYDAPRTPGEQPRLAEGFDRGVRLLVSTTRAPLRLVTFLCAFGALSNLVYSAYVVAVALFKPDVAPGWTSTSLQQSGMFFLLSLVLLVLGEYIMHVAALSGEGPEAYVKAEFTSTHIRQRERLNVMQAGQPFVVADTPRPSEFL